MRTVVAPGPTLSARPAASSDAGEAIAGRIGFAPLDPAVGSHTHLQPRAPDNVARFPCRTAQGASQPDHAIILITDTLRMASLGGACKLLLRAFGCAQARQFDACRGTLAPQRARSLCIAG